METLSDITPLYNKARDFLTKKNYSTEKFKLNFGTTTLLNGWDKNKETDNLGIILLKERNYYLAILNKKNKKVFEDEYITSSPKEDSYYRKMDYKLIPDPSKDLPHIFFSEKWSKDHPISEKIQKIKDSKTYKKGENFIKEDMYTLIDYYKGSIAQYPDWNNYFNFIFSETSSYEDISQFYKEVKDQGYKLTFRNISVSYIDQLVNEGKLFLFQIYNKDFSPHSKGTPNLHTLYWKAIFDPDNLKEVVYKLNGQAEIFFRKKSLEYTKPTHPRGIAIDKKNKENKGKQSLFEYDLIKDKRYTLDKFQFHIPITLNVNAPDKKKDINQMVKEYIQNSEDLNIIGIDRGERNLLYIVVINKRGEILEQVSLNKITNYYKDKEYSVDYHSLLEDRNAERTKARKSWETIKGIKDLKKGYLSQAVYKIIQLMLKYNSIIIMENLNRGFKSSRQKFEYAVYQQFEKALIDKLNYLVDKRKDKNNEGGILKAYQLAPPFDEKKTQQGFLFYVPASYTSKIDPRTGFVSLLTPRYESVEKSKDLLKRFDDFCFNERKGYYELSLDYGKLNKKSAIKKWTLCTYGTRIESLKNKGQWETKEINLTESFTELFNEFGINKRDNLKVQILKQSEKKFFAKLLRLIALTLQMRNSRKEPLEDYIISPVADANGDFFDSRTASRKEPQDADANGAYHIALKGLWIVNEIRMSKNKIEPNNEIWFTFSQEKPFLKEKE